MLYNASWRYLPLMETSVDTSPRGGCRSYVSIFSYKYFYYRLPGWIKWYEYHELQKKIPVGKQIIKIDLFPDQYQMIQILNLILFQDWVRLQLMFLSIFPLVSIIVSQFLGPKTYRNRSKLVAIRILKRAMNMILIIKGHRAEVNINTAVREKISVVISKMYLIN